jgi:hypothetical protein
MGRAKEICGGMIGFEPGKTEWPPYLKTPVRGTSFLETGLRRINLARRSL